MTAGPQDVLMLTHSLSRRAGGLLLAVQRLAQSVAALGQPTRVAGLWDDDFERDRSSWAPLVPEAFRTLGPHTLGFAPRLFPVVRAAADAGALLHVHGLWKLTSLAARCASRARHPRLIVSPHGMLDAWALGQSSLRKRLARLGYEDANLRQAACLHVLGTAELQQVREAGLRTPVAIIPNGVDPPPSSPLAEDPCPEWRGRRVALFLSRLHPKKGLAEFIPAFMDCQPDRAGWALAIAGPDEGNYAAELQRRIQDAGGAAEIRLVGPQYGPQKDAWLRRADLFVLPSLSEGFPIALLEALTYGVPALMTPACNFPEAEQAGAAFTERPERHALANGLRRFWALSPEARRTMGEKGRQLVDGNYTWPKVAEQMLSVYRWVQGAGQKPDCVVAN